MTKEVNRQIQLNGQIITYGNTLFSLGTNEGPFNANKRKRQASGNVEIRAKHKN